MIFRITTKNEFYDGWLAWILKLGPPLKSDSLAMLEGWKMAEQTAGADTTGMGKLLLIAALHEEIDKGRIVVEMRNQ